MQLQNPKGFRDFLPEDALKRRRVIESISKTFQKFGFDPLETPTLEYEETLKGKYGEDEKLIYKFETPGGDKVALKYDQTVPLARVLAQYGPTGMQKITLPFKRFQIQSAFRGENTQKGRYREFLQCDADIIGVASPTADAEILALAYDIYNSLGLKVIIKINDRALLAGIEPQYLAAIDKLNKIGEDGVLAEMERKGLSIEEALNTLNKIKNLTPSDNLKGIIKLFTEMGYPESALQFDQTLIRGLDYYTGLILEVVLENNPTSSSLCGGGRWDNMIGKFTGNDLPAIGFAIGLDRTIEAMDETGVLNKARTGTKVLVGYYSSDKLNEALKLTSELRNKDINAEVWLDPEAKTEKQFKYAEKKGILYIAFVGDAANPDQIKLKNLETGEQNTLTLEAVLDTLS